jgi:hypothetical protein
MEQHKSDQKHNDKSGAAKGIPEQSKRNGQDDMNRDNRDAQKRDNREGHSRDARDSSHNPNQPDSGSNQHSPADQEKERYGTAVRVDEKRPETGKPRHDERVFNTPNRELKGSDRAGK